MTHAPYSVTRRGFHRAAVTSGAGLLLPSIATASPKRAAPSDRIRIGIIGLGSRGFNLLDELITIDEVEIAIVCDVDRLHYRDHPWGKGTRYGRDAAVETIIKSGRPAPEATVDFNEVCGRNDLDAVVVATPDHWHALVTLTATRHGKDVYCEKPVTHTFGEGLAVCDAVARHQTVFQTGSQQRSESPFRRAVELVRNGVLGKIERIEVGLPVGYPAPPGDTTVAAPPKDLDYDLWCGPAPKLPYMRSRHHRWWRSVRAYGGGVLMDWIGHHNDIAHWALDLDDSGPTRVEAVGWQYPESHLVDTPWHYTLECDYESGIASSISDQWPVGTKFVGESGWLHVSRGKLTTSDPVWSKPDFDPGEFRLPATRGHLQNFLDCVRSRDECIAPAETGHRSITPGHLGYVSNQLRRPLRWNPKTQMVLDDPEANAILRTTTYRAPWTLDAA